MIDQRVRIGRGRVEGMPDQAHGPGRVPRIDPRFVEHGDGLRRDRAERGNAVHHLRLDLVGQAMEHGSGHFGIKLDQQHGDGLGDDGLSGAAGRPPDHPP